MSVLGLYWDSKDKWDVNPGKEGMDGWTGYTGKVGT